MGLDFTHSSAMCSTLLEHGAAVVCFHLRPWQAVFKIGITIDMIRRWHYESYAHGHSVEKSNKFVCLLGLGMPPYLCVRLPFCALRNRIAGCAC